MTPEQRDDLVRRVRIAEASAAHRSAMAAMEYRWGGRGKKLSEADIAAIFEARSRGRKVASLAAQYRCSEATICRALARWRPRQCTG